MNMNTDMDMHMDMDMDMPEHAHRNKHRHRHRHAHTWIWTDMDTNILSSCTLITNYETLKHPSIPTLPALWHIVELLITFSN